jgi:hypothetical protein
MTTIDPAQNPKVDHSVREFLRALHSGGGNHRISATRNDNANRRQTMKT